MYITQKNTRYPQHHYNIIVIVSIFFYRRKVATGTYKLTSAALPSLRVLLRDSMLNVERAIGQ